MNNRIRSMLPFLLDLVLSIGGYFLLYNVFGLSTFWALTISGSATGVNAAVNSIRKRRLDALGLLVVLEFALSIVLLAVTRDPRIVLVKPAFYVALGGLYALATLFASKPLAYEAGKPFATKGDPAMLDAYERSWEVSDRFRRAIRSVTIAWGVAFLVEAVARVVIVYSYSAEQISSSIALSQAPSIVLLVAAVVFSRLRMRPLRSVVESNLVKA